jgi:hypothetical protein
MLRWADPTADDIGPSDDRVGGARALGGGHDAVASPRTRFCLGVPLATVTIANPVFAVAVGVLLFGQSISADPSPS